MYTIYREAGKSGLLWEVPLTTAIRGLIRTWNVMTAKRVHPAVAQRLPRDRHLYTGGTISAFN